MTRLESLFSNLKQNNKKALVTYTVAGDPDLDSSESIINNIIESGADVIEIGVPFSDPTAEGPVIQAAHERALENKTSLKDTLKLCKSVRSRFPHTPIVLMGYLNNFIGSFKDGENDLFKEMQQNGVDGALIVDLSFEESGYYLQKFNEYNLDLIRLISLTTKESRIKKIVSNASGYLYCISMKGVTGGDLRDTTELEEQVRRTRDLTNTPMVIGFGIKDGDTARRMSSFSDGAVVGSRLVNEISKFSELGLDELNKNISEIVKELRASMDKK